MPSDSELLRELYDREQVRDVVNRYATSLDTQDREAFRSCFTDRIKIGPFPTLYRKVPTDVSVDDWMDQALTDAAGFERCQHFATNHQIQLHGEQATCKAYVLAQHYMPNSWGEPFATLGGWWTFRMVRTDDGWRIESYDVYHQWKSGNSWVYQAAW